MAKKFDIDRQYDISVVDLASLVGLSERRIQQLERDSTVVRLEHGNYDLVESVRAYCDFLRHSERGSVASKDEQLERTKLTRAKRKLAELTLDETAGALVRVETLHKHHAGLASILKNNLMTIPDRVEAVLAAESDPDKCRLILQGQIREALDDVLGEMDNLRVDAATLDAGLKAVDSESLAS